MTRSVAVYSLIFGAVLMADGAKDAYAQSPYVQSPEGFSQNQVTTCPRCNPSLCDPSCFDCAQLTAAASACIPPPVPPTVPPTTVPSCTTSVTIKGVTLSIGSERPNNCKAGGMEWGMRKATGSAQATVTCSGGQVSAIQSVNFAATGAEATGSSCNWSYRSLTAAVNWSLGTAPSLSVMGWPAGTMLVPRLSAKIDGTNFTLKGQARAPLFGGKGHHHVPASVDMSFSAAVPCVCR